MIVIRKSDGKVINQNCRFVSRTDGTFTVEYKKMMPTFQEAMMEDRGRETCLQNVRETFKIDDFEIVDEGVK